MPGLSIFEVPQQPSLGSLLGMGIGSGVQQGVAQHQQLQQAIQLARAQEAAKTTGRLDLANKMGLVGESGQPSNITTSTTNNQPTPLEPTSIDKINDLNKKARIAAVIGQKELASQLRDEAKMEFEKWKLDKKTGFITPERREDLKEILTTQIGIMKGGKTGWGIKGLPVFADAREARAYLNTLSAEIEATLVPLVSKGTLAKQRFEYILKNLPSSYDTDATLRGKFKALNDIFKLNLDLPSLFKTGKRANKSIEKPSNERKSLEDIFK